MDDGETKGKPIGSGSHTPEQVDAVFGHFAGLLERAEFDLMQSECLASFYVRRNPYALSLGGCACLALAEARGLGVLTAEQQCKKLPGLRVKVKMIR